MANREEEWKEDLNERGEDIHGEDIERNERFHSPGIPTFPVPQAWERRRRNQQFDTPYAGRRQHRSAGFRHRGDDLYYGNLNRRSVYPDLGERGEDTGNRPVWETDRSRRAGFAFGNTGRSTAGQHRGKGPRKYQRPDSRISDDVNDRLADDDFVDASDIEVTVRSCEVYLDGTVNDRASKRRAEDIAESVSGVKNVENRLRVKRNSDWANRDGNIENLKMGASGVE